MASRLMFEVGGRWDGNTLQLNLCRELHQKGAKVLQEAPLDPEGAKAGVKAQSDTITTMSGKYDTASTRKGSKP